MKTARLLLTFYKSFAIASNLITVACLYLIDLYGVKATYIFQALFWFKILTLGSIFYYIQKYDNEVFLYYKNLGLSKKKLWIPTLVFDLTLFILSATVTFKLQ